MRLISFAILILATLTVSATSRHHHSPAVSPAPPPSGGESPSSVPAPSADCDSIVVDMYDCIDFVTSGSNTTKPSSSCCTGLENIVEVSPDCLCEGYNLANQMGISVNMTRATELPRACKVNVPPSAQNCNVSPAPGAGPAGPPDAAAPELPPTSPSTKPPTSPSTEPPSDGSPSAPANGNAAPSPSKGGAYSTSVSLLSLISLFAVYFSFVLA
ncbi:non-specific lipid transfer protein GPI-anchored 4-like isoform X1 [Mercurialis annua]|uniref:non-specific lipid transfer protein GPI-anchored 4-like isoform X1 n=1 Tax=Mercurialis annua TaxID=3986 RepID=UPI00215F466C|nr:non-specific lipid transfer protein GPI-anchored 4-like isoform X1 [Mercurialis annua]